jgi:hypothetical protein
MMGYTVSPTRRHQSCTDTPGRWAHQVSLSIHLDTVQVQAPTTQWCQCQNLYWVS